MSNADYRLFVDDKDDADIYSFPQEAKDAAISRFRSEYPHGTIFWDGDDEEPTGRAYDHGSNKLLHKYRVVRMEIP